MFETLRRAGAHRVLLLDDPPSGLRALLVLDSLVLGPAAGGIRTLAYPDEAAALADAARLARAMSLKCAIAGLAAGGGKTVVMAHPGLDRPRAFRRLGAYVEDLRGLYRTAGDLGTTPEDLRAMSGTTRYVNVREADLSAAAGAGVLSCLRALANFRGIADLRGLRVAVQGCGAMGAAVARALAAAGATLALADLEAARTTRLAEELGASVLPPDLILAADVDIVAPCAAGGVLTAASVAALRAWGVCGAANNMLADADAERALHERGVLMVPDFLSSAGAVIAGVGVDVMGLSDVTPLLAGLGATTTRVLETSSATGVSTTSVARALAEARIAAAGGDAGLAALGTAPPVR